MNARSIVVALLAVAALPLATRAGEQDKKVVALKAARLFDGSSSELKRDAVVVVEGSTIRAVGSAREIPDRSMISPKHKENPALPRFCRPSETLRYRDPPGERDTGFPPCGGRSSCSRYDHRGRG